MRYRAVLGLRSGLRSVACLVGHGDLRDQWRVRLVPRTPVGMPVSAGAAKHALHGSTGSLGSLPNLLRLGLTAGYLLAQGQVRTTTMGRGTL